jgi:hypothetical protein
MAAIGGLQATQLFTGNITVSGTTVGLAAGSELQSFLDDGFLPGQRLSIACAVGPCDAGN